MKLKKEHIEDFKKNNVDTVNRLNRVRVMGIAGIIYGTIVVIMDVVNKSGKFEFAVDISVIVVSLLFFILSFIVMNKLVKKYNLKKYKNSKKNNK